MTQRHLVPCDGCERHVRASEASCPFCGAEVRPTEAQPAPSGRLTRAAIVAFGLTVAATAATTACGNGGTTGQGGTVTQGGGSSGGEGASTGGAVDGDAGSPVSTDDGGGVVAMYGAPTPTPEQSGGGGGGPVTRYGAPAPPSEV